MLVGVWLLITSRFQPSPLASNAACSTAKRRAECVSPSFPVHISSPQQVLCSAFCGSRWYHEAPILNLQGWHLPDPTVDKFPTAVKTDEAVQGMCVPKVDQVEEEKSYNGCESGTVRTEHVYPNGGSGGRRETSNGCDRRRGHIYTFVGLERLQYEDFWSKGTKRFHQTEVPLFLPVPPGQVLQPKAKRGWPSQKTPYFMANRRVDWTDRPVQQSV